MALTLVDKEHQPRLFILEKLVMEMRQRLKRVTEEDIIELGKKLKVDIPKSYKDFLLTTYGGQPLNNTFRKIDSKKKIINEVSVNVFLGVDPREPATDIRANYRTYSDRIPKELLPIAHDGIGNVLCIGIENENIGKIFIWYDKERPLDEPPSYRDIELLAENFDEFTKGLGPEEV